MTIVMHHFREMLHPLKSEVSLHSILYARRFTAKLRKRPCGEVPEWTKGADCKSVGNGLRGFESSPPHHRKRNRSRHGMHGTAPLAPFTHRELNPMRWDR
jgi:hypothetical protein